MGWPWLSAYYVHQSQWKTHDIFFFITIMALQGKAYHHYYTSWETVAQNRRNLSKITKSLSEVGSPCSFPCLSEFVHIFYLPCSVFPSPFLSLPGASIDNSNQKLWVPAVSPKGITRNLNLDSLEVVGCMCVSLCVQICILGTHLTISGHLKIMCFTCIK